MPEIEEAVKETKTPYALTASAVSSASDTVDHDYGGDHLGIMQATKTE